MFRRKHYGGSGKLQQLRQSNSSLQLEKVIKRERIEQAQKMMKEKEEKNKPIPYLLRQLEEEEIRLYGSVTKETKKKRTELEVSKKKKRRWSWGRKKYTGS